MEDKEVIHLGGELPKLSDFTIQQIHDGLEIPNEKAIEAMAYEIRVWRKTPNPDSV